ncbi:GNAT family N-acetyltransferase [Streptacidiphilus jiangxiensis]|uniref:Protein N-acetyltransferase, RimJ/RimL family n=1 Tax=Streptacidiphilus jiangxiensis TaxID=235985 RepID=A0A1H8BYC0_STRJI|nr:GNAT family N-acetyltransferase [Streptacidiphilus jiangxiensis]SEM87763.1 Protein N-acetyltransferase, RimJ/RimL family [Streptacidiphilus jiangxiensis]
MNRRLPILSTARLQLLRLEHQDLDAVAAIHGDPETNRYNPDGAASFETCERWLGTWTGDWEREGFGYFGVVTAEAPDHVIGVAGLKAATIRMPGEASFRALNLYYRFRPTAWGRGYAAEAAGAALDHVRALRPDLPVCALIRADNAPSRRLAERLGLRENGEVDAAGRRVHLLTY